ncbi:MAG: dienelactone hydrolase family protein [Ilumatobacteraceae bacterium]
MHQSDVLVGTVDGPMPVLVADGSAGRPAPVVVMLMDGGGVKPSLVAEAGRLAGHGYVVLLPNLFHRHAGTGPVESLTDMARITELNTSLTNEMAVDDISACLGHAAAMPTADVSRCGLVGYCMGGRLSVVAAQALGDRIAAVASLHPGFMATRSPTSPHLFLDQITAELYIGVPETDPYFSRAGVERLEAALVNAGVAFRLETIAGTTHGFAVPGSEHHSAAGAALVWDRALDLFSRQLQP